MLSKQKRMKTTLSVICSLFVFSFAFPQASFVKAYVVTDKGDTIRGEAKINPKKPTEIYDKVAFKDANGVQKNYKPAKTPAYGLEDANFIALSYDGEPKFYKVLARGPINLYAVAFETMNMNEPVLEQEYFLALPDNKKLVNVKQSKFKKQLLDWMKDNVEIAESYEEEKKFNEENAIAVINKYNEWKATQ
jgi:hypothetical protein